MAEGEGGGQGRRVWQALIFLWSARSGYSGKDVQWPLDGDEAGTRMGGRERAILGILGVAMVWTVAGWDKGPLSYGTWTEWNGPGWPMLPLSKDHGKRAGGEEKSRNQLPRFRARPSLHELRSASASRHANYARPPHRILSLSGLGGWEWEWEWWVEELTEGTFRVSR